MGELQGILKALSDETRFNIVELLLKHDFCVGALAKQLNISGAAVSQHLQVLRKAGLVTGEKRGYFTHYVVNRHLLAETADKMHEMASQRNSVEGGCHNFKLGKCRRGKEIL